jgi:hypothetical protein
MLLGVSANTPRNALGDCAIFTASPWRHGARFRKPKPSSRSSVSADSAISFAGKEGQGRMRERTLWYVTDMRPAA